MQHGDCSWWLSRRKLQYNGAADLPAVDATQECRNRVCRPFRVPLSSYRKYRPGGFMSIPERGDALLAGVALEVRHRPVLFHTHIGYRAVDDLALRPQHRIVTEGTGLHGDGRTARADYPAVDIVMDTATT